MDNLVNPVISYGDIVQLVSLFILAGGIIRRIAHLELKVNLMWSGFKRTHMLADDEK